MSQGAGFVPLGEFQDPRFENQSLPHYAVRMILRCTAKALDLLGGRGLALVDVPPADDDWYLNLLWMDRRKCLLLTHAGTIFSIFIPDVRKADLSPLGPYVVGAITSALSAEGLPHRALGDLDPQEVLLAKTASRRVLGYMNDIAVHVCYAIAHQGGLGLADIARVNREIRRTLQNHGGRYTDPMELIQEGLERAGR